MTFILKIRIDTPRFQCYFFAMLGRSLDLTDKTVRSYLDILTGTFMVTDIIRPQEALPHESAAQAGITILNSCVFQRYPALEFA